MRYLVWVIDLNKLKIFDWRSSTSPQWQPPGKKEIKGPARPSLASPLKPRAARWTTNSRRPPKLREAGPRAPRSNRKFWFLNFRRRLGLWFQICSHGFCFISRLFTPYQGQASDMDRYFWCVMGPTSFDGSDCAIQDTSRCFWVENGGFRDQRWIQEKPSISVTHI